MAVRYERARRAGLVASAATIVLVACESASGGSLRAPSADRRASTLEIEVASPVSTIDAVATGDQVVLKVSVPVGAPPPPYRLLLDDAPGFRQPLADMRSNSDGVALDWRSTGMVPGTRYYLRLDPMAIPGELVLWPEDWSTRLPAHEFVLHLWQGFGRPYLRRFAGVRWQDAGRKWHLVSDWPPPGVEIGQRAYYLEYALRGAVNLALVSHDLHLIDELAAFCMAYFARFETLGELRAKIGEDRPGVIPGIDGPDGAMTLAWIAERSGDKVVEECALCSLQFMHPVARLIRLVSTLADDERTTAMNQLVKTYTPVIVRDHLIRLAYGTTPATRIDGWERVLAKAGAEPSLATAMRDTDLWLTGTAAEMLGAHSNRADLVQMSAVERQKLQRIVSTGVALFQSSRTLYEGTRDFRGRIVGSATYFEGDFDAHRDMAYARDSGDSFPKGAPRRPKRGSWDISHAYRIPVFLRSLHDNRKATGLAFPDRADIDLVVNQYLYVVFNGDYKRPLFANFFDGNDGWYRVGYARKDFGYPPSRHCNSTPGSRRPCLTSGAVYGWGLLAFANPDLERLQLALIEMATDPSPEATRFRATYYHSLTLDTAELNSEGSLLLFNILSGTAEHLGRQPLTH